MLIREVQEEEKEEYDKVVTHPLQSWAWGEFRIKTGLKVIRLGVYDGQKLISGYQLTIHSLLPTAYSQKSFAYTLGYLPKGPQPNLEMLESLKKIGKQNNCLFIKLEPNSGFDPQVHEFLLANGCRIGKPLFTKYTFVLDLSKSEEELLAQMKEKTRYNTRLAQKQGVTVTEDNSPVAFENYLKLSKETTTRQHFYAHDEKYHRLMWETLQPNGIAHLLLAQRSTPYDLQPTTSNSPLVAWILFLFNDVLYYPYGASSSENREVMASNLMMWEAIKWGKAHDAKFFDLWGALGPNPDPKDPWYGFHRFKEGYGATLTESIGTYDLVLNPFLYKLYNLADKLRWTFLKLKSYFR